MNLNYGFVLFIISIIEVHSQYQSEASAKILSYTNNVDLRNWDYSFDTENNIHQDQTGVWIGTGEIGPNGEELGVNNVNGYATFYLGDGTPFSLSYNADQNGYRPRYVIGSIVGRSSDSLLNQIGSRAGQFSKPVPRPEQFLQPGQVDSRSPQSVTRSPLFRQSRPSF